MKVLRALLKNRFEFVFMCIFMSLVLVLGLNYSLEGYFSVVFLGYSGDKVELTFQVVMWCMFAVGMLLTARRIVDYDRARKDLGLDYLPSSDEVVLQAQDLRPIFTRVGTDRKRTDSYLASLIHIAIVQFQTSKSVEQTTSLVNSQLGILAEEVDSRYAFIRYFSWLLPTMGFMGTVYGISVTVATVGKMSPQDPKLLSTIASSLAVAFDTTLVALVQTAILLLFSTYVQQKEEGTLNQSGQYVLTNLVNRLYRDW